MKKIKEIKYFVIILLILFSTLIINSEFVESTIETERYIIHQDNIEIEITPNSINNQIIKIENKLNKEIEVFVLIEQFISEYVEFKNNNFKVLPKDFFDLNLVIYGSEKETNYSGNIIFTGDIEENIDIKVFVKDKEERKTGALMVDLDVLNNKIYLGNNLNYMINIFYLAKNKHNETEVNIKEIIRPIKKEDNYSIIIENIIENNFTTNLTDSRSIFRSYEIPKNFEEGDYEIKIEINYLNFSSEIKGFFILEIPFHMRKIGGLISVWALSVFLISISLIFMIINFIKKEIEKKKRFHVKVEYKLLPKQGERTVFVGMVAETNHKFYLDIDTLTVHTIIAGSTGAGKSISTQDIIEGCLEKGISVAVFDPTAQWSGMLRKLTDKKLLEYYAPMGMDTKKDPKAYPGNIKAIKDHREKVEIFKYLKNPGEIQVFTTNTMDPKNYDIFVANMIQQVFHSNLSEYRGLRYLMVFDEIHRILPKFGGSGEGFIQIERACREFRKWGIGILLISQVLSDFVGEIKANINTQIQMKTKDEGDLDRIKMQYGEEFIHGIVKSPVGSGMVQNSTYNKGRPFFVTFRPIKHSVKRLTDEELDQYNKYNNIVDDLEYQLEQLETEHKQDIFDLKLELKLSKDKIKSGSFNMVKIYLEGLTPRIQKIWDKLQKTPKKLQTELIDNNQLQQELEKAKQEKQKELEKQKLEESQDAQKQEIKGADITDPENKDNLEQVKRLFQDIETAIQEKDWYTINDRLIEIESTPLQTKEKKETLQKIQETKKRVEQAKQEQKKDAVSK
jgi:hypothetical protein